MGRVTIDLSAFIVKIGLLTGAFRTNNTINLFQQTHQQYIEPRELVELALFNNAAGHSARGKFREQHPADDHADYASRTFKRALVCFKILRHGVRKFISSTYGWNN